MTNPYYIPPADDETFKESAMNQFGTATNVLGSFASNPTPTGAIMAGAQAGITEIGDVFKDRRSEKDLISNLNQFNVPDSQVDQFGQPIYNFGQSFNNLSNTSVNDVGKFQLKDYSGISPAANLVRGFDTLFGGKKRRKKAKEAKKKALARLQTSQNKFNDSNVAFNQQLASQEERQNKIANRFNNLYSIPSTIY